MSISAPAIEKPAIIDDHAGVLGVGAGRQHRRIHLVAVVVACGPLEFTEPSGRIGRAARRPTGDLFAK